MKINEYQHHHHHFTFNQNYIKAFLKIFYVLTEIIHKVILSTKALFFPYFNQFERLPLKKADIQPTSVQNLINTLKSFHMSDAEHHNIDLVMSRRYLIKKRLQFFPH